LLGAVNIGKGLTSCTKLVGAQSQPLVSVLEEEEDWGAPTYQGDGVYQEVLGQYVLFGLGRLRPQDRRVGGDFPRNLAGV